MRRGNPRIELTYYHMNNSEWIIDWAALGLGWEWR